MSASTPVSTLKRSTALAIALTIGLMLGACSRSPTGGEQTAPAKPNLTTANMLVRGNGPEPDSLDPQKARTFEAATVLRDMYECLTALGKDAGAVPALATGWAVSTDGRTYTFKLRSEARWSNGDRVVAADVVAGLQRLVDPKTAAQYAQVVDVIENASDIVAGKKPPNTLGVTTPDEATVVIQLKSPAPYLPSLLTHPSTCPIHRGELARLGDEAFKPGKHISNGAFVLQEWVQGSHIQLQRNHRYWNDAATHLDGVRFVSNADENAEFNRYRGGELHTTAVVPRTQFAQVKQEYGQQLHLGPQLGTNYYGFNLDREPFKSQPGLRRALSLVIDRERLVEAVTQVGELPAYSWVPPGIYNYGTQAFDYRGKPMADRIREARALYAVAGYSAAKPLHFELRYNTGKVQEKLAVAVASMWTQALGVDVKLAAEEFKVMLRSIDARSVDIFRSSWIGDYNDPYTFAQYLKGNFGINLPHYHSAIYDELLAKAAAEVDVAKRRGMLEQAERTMLADHPLLPLYFYVNKHLVSPRVHGWYDNVMNVVYSKDLSLDP